MVSQTKIKERTRKKENPSLKSALNSLRKADKFWVDIAAVLSKSRKRSAKVNLDKLNRETKEGDVVVVPGKVLASGNMDHKIILGALSFSEKAREKMKGAKVLSLEEMEKSYKNGKGVKVIA